MKQKQIINLYKMRNKPKYNFFKNTSYALQGIANLIKTEMSFKIELFLAIILIPIIIFIDVKLIYKIVMFTTLMGVIIAEIINSAIERIVDLITANHNDLAKSAKDIGSALVFVSIITFTVVWGMVMWDIVDL